MPPAAPVTINVPSPSPIVGDNAVAQGAKTQGGLCELLKFEIVNCKQLKVVAESAYTIILRKACHDEGRYIMRDTYRNTLVASACQAMAEGSKVDCCAWCPRPVWGICVASSRHYMYVTLKARSWGPMSQ